MQPSDKESRRRLTPEQYDIMRRKDTNAPGSEVQLSRSGRAVRV